MIDTAWYALLEMPPEVTEKLGQVKAGNPCTIQPETKEACLCRATAEQGFETLKQEIGPDPDGMKQLYALLEMADETWKKYGEKGISADIFAETMKFVPRFLRAFHQQTGAWKFAQGWWFWREVAMVEFRVGCLEYELVEEKERRFISLHIPADADMSEESIDASFAAFRAFLSAYYPDWQNLPWECDSWMMSPALEYLLPEKSKILAFQRRFQVLEHNADSMGVMEWVFPGHKEVSESLPETTSLQRKMKAWLLSGKKVGWTRAGLK